MRSCGTYAHAVSALMLKFVVRWLLKIIIASLITSLSANYSILTSLPTVNIILLKLLCSTLTTISSIHFSSTAVAVDSSHVTASSSASWSRFSPPSNLVNGHVSTMWFMVCRWPQSQEGEWARPHLCKFAWHGPWPVRKRFSRDHVRRGRSKPGCRIVGSVTIVWLTTEADDQSSLQKLDQAH